MNIKKTAFLMAMVSAFSAMANISAGAVNFSENEKGVKTWIFEVSEEESDYPEGVTTLTNGDKQFVGDTTYYVKNGYTKTRPEDLSDYLTLETKNSNTLEGKQYSSLYLYQKGASESSELSWEAPADGKITLTTCNELNVYINDIFKEEIPWVDPPEATSTRTYDLKQGDILKMSGPKYCSIHEVKFTPNTYSAAYQFTKTADELGDGVLKVTSSVGEKRMDMSDVIDKISGECDVVFGLIIKDVPNNVDITGAEIVFE